MEHLKPKMVKK